jgi:hypothetical protein
LANFPASDKPMRRRRDALCQTPATPVRYVPL